MTLRQSRSSPLSTRRMLELREENSRQERELEKELSRLEKERLVKIRELRQEMQNFRISSARSRSTSRSRSRSPPRSPTARNVSPYPSSPSLSPRQHLDCSLSAQVSDRPHSRNREGYGSSRENLHIIMAQDGSTSSEMKNLRFPSLSAGSGHSTPYQRPHSPRVCVPEYAKSSSPSSSMPQQCPGRRAISPNPYTRTISLDSCDSGPPTPSSLSPNASPSTSPKSSPRRMLSRRPTVEQNGTRRAVSPGMNVTSTTISVLNHEWGNIRPGPKLSLSEESQPQTSKQRKSSFASRSSSSTIPQIVISSHTRSPTPPLGALPLNSALCTREANGLASESSSDESLNIGTSVLTSGQPMTESLTVPIRRGRSRSVPTIPEPCTTYLRALAKRESSFETADIAEDLNVAQQAGETRPITRARSSSICVPYFSHLKDAPRRDSLLRKYTARRGSYRRTSCTIERLIADLARGVPHAELISDPAHSKLNISAEEWDKLRQCRYLRMPRRSAGELVNQTELGIKEIFS